IKGAWSGLTDFVGTIFDGVSSAIKSVVDSVKGFINVVIRGINSAIGIINKIPGVSISKIEQLQTGTDNFGGGFARMNEGGRGELVILPSGSQVIPHDATMKYAKESARNNNSSVLISQGSDLRYVETLLEKLLQKDPVIKMNDKIVSEVVSKNQANSFNQFNYTMGGAAY
ncbi:hypothetical protein HB798_14045, partial [Listeria welshimeri]|nr:hypothetical protein [Listeria welshimeri]